MLLQQTNKQATNTSISNCPALTARYSTLFTQNFVTFSFKTWLLHLKIGNEIAWKSSRVKLAIKRDKISEMWEKSCSFLLFSFFDVITLRENFTLYNNNNTNTIQRFYVDHMKWNVTSLAQNSLRVVECATVDNKQFQWNNLNENKKNCTTNALIQYTYTKTLFLVI